MGSINVNSIDKESGSTLTLGGSGTTVAVHASATTSGFGSPAYASNASATDDTVNVDASDNLQFNSGYGSTATAYGCRAWVSFNGQGTVAILDSGNVSSITDNGTGDYTVNFTTAMPDTNYSVAIECRKQSGGNAGTSCYDQTFVTNSVRIKTFQHYNQAAMDFAQVMVSVIR